MSILSLILCQFMHPFVFIVVTTGPAGEVNYLGQSLNFGHLIVPTFSSLILKL